MREVILIKLGGSLITDKTGESVARPDVIARLTREIAAARPALDAALVLGHGSGSFGHAAAARHGIGRGSVGQQALLGASETRHKAAQLHELVTASLIESGIESFSWAPSSAMTARAGKPLSASIEPLMSALDSGFLPVTYGDVVMDQDWGASICSTEAVLTYLVGRLRRRGKKVRRVLWLGATDGIFDADGVTVPRIDRSNLRRVERMIGETTGTDVTGGMLLRLETARLLARRGIESWILNGNVPELLTASLLGQSVPGTRVIADS